MLEEGRLIPADAVVFATGYSTGNSHLRLDVDGKELCLGGSSRDGLQLLRHLILPDMPVGFAVSSAAAVFSSILCIVWLPP